MSQSNSTNPDIQPLVAICMTAYNPPADLFARQIQSIAGQTYRRWICIISDDNSRADFLQHIRKLIAGDARFILHAQRARLGFYYNFERCLRLVPEEAQLIALSDQDDAWHPDKLETLVAGLQPDTTLIYSDMNIVDVKGRLLASTYWTQRPNNYSNFASLMLANTVTGAASLFPRWLLEYALPFPTPIGEAYHDHWIACVALALGNIRYLDRPLYDYVQHQSNIIGHFSPAKEKFIIKLLKFLAKPRDWKRTIGHNLWQWRAIFFHDLIRVEVLAQIIEARCGERLPKAKRQTLRRLAHLETSWRAQLWLALRSLRNVGRTSETLGAENSLLRALFWKRYIGLKSRLPLAAINRGASVGEAARKSDSLSTATAGNRRIEVIQEKIAPLKLKIALTAAERVNLMIPVIDFRYLFGGYITKLNLARCLAEDGHRVRIILVDPCDLQPAIWRQQLRAYDGLERLLDQVEIVPGFDRSQAIEVSHNDSFIATTWWTAHLAQRAVSELGKQKFVYLIQEYEPFTFEMGSFAALAAETYRFPHAAIFSTELLREYFRENRLGVFSENHEDGERHSLAFQNTITTVGRMQLEDLTNRRKKRLLFYARPEAHAARNLFEIAALGLTKAVNRGAFKGEWEFSGIGTAGDGSRVSLANGIWLNLLPRQSQESYRGVLRRHDLGLSLMYTPHPSLVPIEMAAAGMLVITNTYANKTRDKMAAISSNILAVEPTIDAIVNGLQEAADGIEDYERRLRGSQVNWATTWEEAFNAEVMTKINAFISASRNAISR